MKVEGMNKLPAFVIFKQQII